MTVKSEFLSPSPSPITHTPHPHTHCQKLAKTAGLLSLSNELLIQIFTACPTVQTAMRLSSVSKRLRAVWLQHTDQIVEDIIKSTSPAAEQAIDCAMTETRLRNSLGADGRPSLRLWLPNLMRDADLCASAHAACAAYVEPSNHLRKTPMKFPSSPAHWYFLRRVRLAFEYPQLRDAVHAELLAASEETREKLFRFHWFLVGFASKEEVIRQGIPLDLRFPVPPYPDEGGNDMHEDPWRYCDDVICSARCYPTSGPDYLSLAIQGYNN